MKVLGVNAVFHDPAAALVVDGRIVAAAEEERFTRRKHGKRPVPFATWELPEQAARWCLDHAGLRPADVDAVAYSYDPAQLGADVAAAAADGTLTGDITADAWEPLRTLYAARAPWFLRTALPGLVAPVTHVPHHVAHAASAYLAAPLSGADCSVLTLDGRGETATALAGRVRDGHLEQLGGAHLPDSLGLLYEELTAHLGFERSSDEYKIMALASYGEPRWIDRLRQVVAATGDGGFVAPASFPFGELLPRRAPGEPVTRDHADLAASVQMRLEEVLLDLATWLWQRTGDDTVVMAGGVALNCVANSRLWREGPFQDVWVQPAAGDAGTALGAALYVARAAGDGVQPMTTAALGPDYDDQAAGWLRDAGVAFDRPADVAEVVADALAADRIVAWFQGRAEFGPRALGHRSLLADPRNAGNIERLNRVKGRESFRPVAPMIRTDRAAEVFTAGPLPSPYMLFTHSVRDGWQHAVPAALHVDKTARAQTVAPGDEPLAARMLAGFESLTGVPAVINTSLNSAGRPIVGTPRDALECLGSAPIDLLAVGPCIVARPLAGSPA